MMGRSVHYLRRSCALRTICSLFTEVLRSGGDLLAICTDPSLWERSGRYLRRSGALRAISTIFTYVHRCGDDLYGIYVNLAL